MSAKLRILLFLIFFVVLLLHGYGESGVLLIAKNNSTFCLTAKDDGNAVMVQCQDNDCKQVWEVESWPFFDQVNQQGFTFTSVSSGRRLCHGNTEWQEITTCSPGALEGSILWTYSVDNYQGYFAVRPLSNVELNMDVKWVNDGTVNDIVPLDEG